ncbi:MAG TPA: GNAT family N-acetyltransferase [Pseudonocardiaceae bacterium]
MPDVLCLKTVTMANVREACRLWVRPDQEKYVAPVAVSLAEAYTQPTVAWPRLVYAGDRPVAFVMGGFDPDGPRDFFRAGICRLNVAAEHQGRGYGRFAVLGVMDEARRRGYGRVTVLWMPGRDGPEGFYLRLGFRPTGQRFHGQVVAALLV